MNSRERIEWALNHKEPDRTPIFEYVLRSPIADQLLGRPYAVEPQNWDSLVQEKGWESAVRQRAIDQLELAILLDHDMLYVVPNPSQATTPFDTHAPASGNTEDPVECVRVRNERADREPAIPDETFMVYSFIREEMENRDLDFPILAPAYSHGVWTDVNLMQTMLLAPEIAHDHFFLATRHSLSRIEKYIALGIDQIGVGGDFSGTRPLISPQAYREFIVPEVRKLSRRIHNSNRHAVNASDGNLWPVLDDFLFGCEVDGYLEIDMHAGMDIGRLKRSCANRITLYGNLDSGNILSFGTPADVRTHTIECLESGMGSGGHILCASNAITASVPFENYLAVVNAYREMFCLPKFNKKL